MKRIGSRFRLLPGRREEYIRRHDELWPEMAQAMREAGIRNYTIWLSGSDLFGYYEADDEEACARALASSPVVKRWNEGMKDIIVFDQPPMECVFLFEGGRGAHPRTGETSC